MKRIFSLSVPSKTFLAGEYVALTGGPVLVLTTEPRFSLEVIEESSAGTSTVCPFHPESPAGRFWTQHQDYFSRYTMTFIDPLKGLGGFGASSAQFALLHGLFQLHGQLNVEAERFFDWHSLLRDYRALHIQAGSAPSGADVVAQCRGGLTYFARTEGQLQGFAWPFSEVELLCFHTGKKLSTHEHLKNLHLKDLNELEASVRTMQEALSQLKWDEFLSSWKTFSLGLEDAGLVAPETLVQLKTLRADSRIVFARGCGAMGADVILVATLKTQDSTVLKKDLAALGLQFVSSSSQISEGLRIQSRMQPHEVHL